MLPTQEELPLSQWSGIYDVVVPKDNRLRRMNDLVDFSFILEELKSKYCQDNGRKAICPIQMFKYLILKSIFELSDVDVVERSQYDMSFKYFLDIAPDAKVIDPSSLTKFRRKRLLDNNLLDLLIGKTVQLALEHQIIKKDTIIVDATHTRSRYQSKSAMNFIQEKSKQLRKTIYQYDETIREQFPTKSTSENIQDELTYTQQLVSVIEKNPSLLNIPSVSTKLNVVKEVLQDCEHESKLSEDKDAKTGYKSADHSFFGFKSHLSMTDERIITAAVITAGDKADGKYLADLVEKSEAAGMEIRHVIGDTAYSGRTNLKYAETKRFKLISKLHPVITHGARKEDQFIYVKDADRYMCPAGHLSKTKGRIKRRIDETRSDQLKYFWDVSICKSCPLRDGCYRDGAKTKTYSITIPKSIHLEQESFQNTEEFKELARSRYKIEAKNSELKNAHGYNKAITSGLFGMHIQAASTIFAVNMKRIIKLIDEKEVN